MRRVEDIGHFIDELAHPWTEGPRELLHHAAEHYLLGSAFDLRIAMISADNAVELMMKTYLGLPERARGSRGPSRRDLEQASESFPALLSLLETHAPSKVAGLRLDHIEWYHRLRNQLYHSGNGITVAGSMVEAYIKLAVDLFRGLFSGLDFTVHNGARMVAHWPERIEKAQRQTMYSIGGILHDRVGWSKELDYCGDGVAACPDCGVHPAQLHVVGCDMERCPICSGQVITCDCAYDDEGEEDEDNEPSS